jgi:hypothetical protein
MGKNSFRQPGGQVVRTANVLAIDINLGCGITPAHRLQRAVTDAVAA